MATLYDEDGNPFEVDDSLLNPQQQDAGQDQGGGGPRTNSDFAALRRANAATKKAEQDRVDAQKALAFYKAGIDPEKGIASYFAKAYDGPLDPDAIRAKAIEDGIMQPPPPTAEDQAQQQALQSQQRISGAAGAALTAPDAFMAQRQALDDAYKAGGIEGLAAAMAAAGIPQTLN
jgi:hypothetical protein